MQPTYYRKHYYITYQDRSENSGKYPHDIILERLIAYDVAQKYIAKFFEATNKQNTLSVQSTVYPILITNDTRLYSQFRNVFSESEFQKYCIEDRRTSFETYDHFIKIVEGRYNTAEMYTKSEDWTDESGNTYNVEYENGWRTSTYMISNKILTNGINYADEGYKDDVIKINDHHYVWWGKLENNWKEYFSYLLSNGIFGGIPTHFALADILTLEEFNYEFGGESYSTNFQSIEPLSQLSFLRSVNLKNHSIKDISPIGNVKTLNHLNIENNQVESVLPLQDLQNLKELNVSRNRILNFDAIPSLKKLIINSNSINDILNITKSRDLEYLEINYNKISDLTELPMLKNLKYLSLSGNKIADIEPLSALQNLQVLKLDYNQIESIEPLKKVKSLTELSIRNNNLNDISPISKLLGLKKLDCGGNQFSYGEALSLSSKLGFTLNFW